MPNQEFGLVPIVEPEILIDGSHDIATTARIQERVLTTVYAKLQVLSPLYLRYISAISPLYLPYITTVYAKLQVPRTLALALALAPSPSP